MSIHWSIQTLGTHPNLVRELPPRWLSTPEILRFSRLKNDKRRREWLIGRWTAKRLLLAMLMRSTGQVVFHHQIAIENDPRRVPYGMLLSDQGWLPLPHSLSISHSHDRALCATLEGEQGTVGADIERVEARSHGFAEAYFTSREVGQVRRAAISTRAMVTAAIWSAKESALKALHLGLSVDTRSLNCHFGLPVQPPATWTAFQIELDEDRLAAGGQRHSPAGLAGWWRVQDGFVLTIVHCTPCEQTMITNTPEDIRDVS